MPGQSTFPPPVPVQRAARSLGEHFRTRRKLLNLTERQVAERAGVDRKTVSRIETDTATTSVGALLRVARALGILDGLIDAVDPHDTEVGRLRASEQLPERVRPRALVRSRPRVTDDD
jgi:transcriptional regulator with XRE-family HTH domain